MACPPGRRLRAPLWHPGSAPPVAIGHLPRPGCPGTGRPVNAAPDRVPVAVARHRWAAGHRERNRARARPGACRAVRAAAAGRRRRAHRCRARRSGRAVRVSRTRQRAARRYSPDSPDSPVRPDRRRTAVRRRSRRWPGLRPLRCGTHCGAAFTPVSTAGSLPVDHHGARPVRRSATLLVSPR
jgi:hypothetical protein